ncbi:DNA helicase, partial [Acinetobacter baumannii]
FDKVSFNYYEQLNGYSYLKSLGIGYHFYKGRYFAEDDEGVIAIAEVLDTDKKTIIHIPNVNSGESTKDKYDEVDAILEIIGEFVAKD